MSNLWQWITTPFILISPLGLILGLVFYSLGSFTYHFIAELVIIWKRRQSRNSP